MKNSEKKYFSIFSVIVIILAALSTVAALKVINDRYAIDVPPAPLANPPKILPPGTKPVPPPTANGFTIPTTKLLNVPFTPQAPTANWDELHGEACEEASSIMAHAYFTGITDELLKPEFVEQELTKLTEWEKENLGYYLDINAEETARMVREVYGLTAIVSNNVSENAIKEQIARGNLILFPAQGQQLGNPNFRRPGPPYHMIVIRGYNSQGFVTNDPGTRKGANYTYTFDVLYAANGDFDHAMHAVDTNKKVMIIVSKN